MLKDPNVQFILLGSEGGKAPSYHIGDPFNVQYYNTQVAPQVLHTYNCKFTECIHFK